MGFSVGFSGVFGCPIAIGFSGFTGVPRVTGVSGLIGFPIEAGAGAGVFCSFLGANTGSGSDGILIECSCDSGRVK